MFGREPHSREGFEELQKKTDEAKAAALENPGSSWSTGEVQRHEQYDGSFQVRNVYKRVPTVEEETYWKMMEKLEKMKNKGHAEALELESKHNQLLQKVEDANRALTTFETEQLEMHKEA